VKKPQKSVHMQELQLQNRKLYSIKKSNFLIVLELFFSSEMSESDAALRNCLNLDQLEDFTLPIKAILSRCSKENLLTIYGIANFVDAVDFLRLVSLKRGKILKGGISDYPAAARLVMKDWNTGTIPYYSIPPEVDPSIHVGAEIVNTWSKEFNLNDVMEQEVQNVLSSLKSKPEKFIYAAKQKPSPIYGADPMFENLAEDEEIEVEYRKESTFAIAPIKEKKKDPTPTKRRKLSLDSDNPQTNQKTEKEISGKRKKEKKMQVEDIEDKPYDFGTDFWRPAEEKSHDMKSDKVIAFSF